MWTKHFAGIQLRKDKQSQVYNIYECKNGQNERNRCDFTLKKVVEWKNERMRRRERRGTQGPWSKDEGPKWRLKYFLHHYSRLISIRWKLTLSKPKVQTVSPSHSTSPFLKISPLFRALTFFSLSFIFSFSFLLQIFSSLSLDSSLHLLLSLSFSPLVKTLSHLLSDSSRLIQTLRLIRIYNVLHASRHVLNGSLTDTNRCLMCPHLGGFFSILPSTPHCNSSFSLPLTLSLSPITFLQVLFTHNYFSTPSIFSLRFPSFTLSRTSKKILHLKTYSNTF